MTNNDDFKDALRKLEEVYGSGLECYPETDGSVTVKVLNGLERAAQRVQQSNNRRSKQRPKNRRSK